jgi:hypothetical protein
VDHYYNHHSELFHHHEPPCPVLSQLHLPSFTLHLQLLVITNLFKGLFVPHTLTIYVFKNFLYINWEVFQSAMFAWRKSSNIIEKTQEKKISLLCLFLLIFLLFLFFLIFQDSLEYMLLIHYIILLFQSVQDRKVCYDSSVSLKVHLFLPLKCGLNLLNP